MFADLTYRLRAVFRRDRMDADLDEEIRLHVEREAEASIERGVEPDEARRLARLALGGQEQIKDACRDARGVAALETLAQDLRYAVRVLRKSPAYSAAAILTLALGIGLNTTIFTLVNGLLLRPLPVREPDRLVALNRTIGVNTIPFFGVAEWEQVRDRPQLFERACAYQARALNLSPRGQVDNVQGLIVSGSYFDTLGIRAAVGRMLDVADDQPGGGPDGPAAVISDRFWKTRFDGAPDVVGRTLTIERVPHTVVGVTPPGFFGASAGATFEVAIPIGTLAPPRQRQDQVDRSLYLTLIARLGPAQTRASAAAALAAATPGMLQSIDATAPAETWSLADLSTGTWGMAREYRRPLQAMTALAALVLLIVCASVANLSLARAATRYREMCMRRALGASWWRLVHQVLIESLLVSASGAALGLGFARVFGPVLVRQLSTTVSPAFLDLSLDWRVMLFTSAAAAGTAVLVGMAPAWRAGGAQPQAALKEGDRGHAGTGRLHVNHALVVAQVALSLALVLAAGLFVRTFHALATRDLGFDRDEVLMVRIDGENSRVPPEDRAALDERVRQAVASVPGVASAVALRSVPVSPDHWVAVIDVPGHPRPQGARTAFLNSVSPGWFAMFGTPLLIGRDFSEQESANSELVAIVNEAFARRFCQGANPVNEALRFGGDDSFGPPFRIVGLARDSGAATYFGLREAIPPTVYLHANQRRADIANFTPLVSFRIGVSAADGSPTRLVRTIAASIERIDPSLKTSFRTMADYVDATLVKERLAATLAGLFGALALLLSAVGLYGVTAHSVSRRRAEIGLRIALGATPGSVVRAVLKTVLTLTGIGLVLGGMLSYWSARFIAAFLFGLEPRDPATFAGAACVLALVAILAGWLPARHAARIDPATVLRSV